MTNLYPYVMWAHLEYKKNRKKWIARRRESSISVSETITFVIYGHTSIYIYFVLSLVYESEQSMS